ncbi:MAG TPA: hypothetical protein VFC07_08675, partial [Verrucomicrobiae bacterium]|nr:hypothetical protein [Verrucomicrobiae bacterium]
LPFAWENTIWGFQSQFYFLLFLSLLTIWLLGLSESFSIRWWLGVIAAVAALFTMASGFMAAVAVAALALFEILKQWRRWRRHLPALAVCLVIAAAGLISKPAFLKGYVFSAGSIGALLTAFSKNLAWPWVSMPWFALCNLFPLALFGWNYFRARDKECSPAEKMVFGITIWVALQALGLAYARGAGGKPPVSRYMDICSFVMIADWLCILTLLSRQRLRFAPLLYAGFALWGIGCAAGLWRLSDRDLRLDIPDVELCQRLRLESMRAFLATDDATRLGLAEDCNFLPIERQARLLRNPYIRHVLPSCVRDSLKVVRNEDNDQAFARNGFHLDEAEPPTEISWGSYSRNGAGARGGFETLPVKKSSLPFLEIPVAGDLGEAGLSLELVDLATGKTTTVQPPRIAGGRWLNVYVQAPAGEFKLLARDTSETKWFAFKEPRELGRLSLWTLRLLAAWKYILAAGLGCLLLNLGLLFRGSASPARS